MHQANYAHAKFGIDEIYIHEAFPPPLLEKLYHRATSTLDAENNIVKKHASHDMILIFYQSIPTQNLIFRFLKYFDEDRNKEDFIKSNTLLNEEELFASIKTKKFFLITHRVLVKQTHVPKGC